MAKDDKKDDILNDEDDFSQLDWKDISTEIAKNKRMLLDDYQENVAVTTEQKTAKPNSGEVELEFLQDVSLELYVGVGSKKLRIADLLKYSIGSIIELDNMVGQPLNIFINDVLIGLGEIVEKDQKYGIKIVELLDENQRLQVLSTKAFSPT